MVFALSENEGGARRGARSSYPLLSDALGKSLRPMAGKHSGLVHQPPGLVGPSNTGRVPKSEVRSRRQEVRRNQCGAKPSEGQRKRNAESRKLRYLFPVRVGAL